LNPYKTRKIAKIIAIIIVAAMIITSFSFIVFIPSLLGLEGGSVVYAASSNDEYLNTQTQKLKEYMEYIQQNYKDDVDYETLVNGAFEGIINSLGDPYSVYYGTAEEGSEFIESVSGEFSGIGVSVENFNGQCRVVAPVSGTPAERSGIKSGDIITKIDNIDITSKTLEEAVALMRGEAGTKVTVTINRNGQVLTFTLTREKIKNASVNYKMLENNIGYIQITSFDNDTNVEFRLALTALVNKGMDSLILDIRNNPGGYIATASDVANQLMPKGPIAYFEQKGKTVDSISADGSAQVDVPMVLLVNEGSASASEILAGALKDSKTATLVGTTTFGKGVAQQVVSVTSETSMKLSMFYFLTPNKSKIDHIGITPDYTVQNTTNVNEEELTKEYAGFAPMIEKVKPKAGDTGLNVYGAQQRLSMLGYTLDVTGTMDQATVAAVKKFQKENGLSPYSVLDYTTMRTIDNDVIAYITGTKDSKDLQLEKAIELLK